jgi:hypothetical protein
MKTYNALLKSITFLLISAAMAFSNGAAAQNLITNPGFSNGTSGWSTDCSMEINPESVYGGVSSTNSVTEIDVERCFNQQISVSPGAIYDLSYLASRRQGATPATVGVTVTITGVQSGIQYLNVNRTYSNTGWGFTTESFSFTLPSNTTDTRVNIKFSNYLTTGTYGTIVDDINFSVDAQSSVLPLKLMTFAGEMKNNKATLNWKASNDENDGQYFVVERARVSGSFDSIGVVAVTGTSYTFVDNRMPDGSFDYKLKMVSRAGYTYSKIINLDNAGTSGLQLFPNPASSFIGFKLTSVKKSTVNVQVFSASGAMVSMKQVQLNMGVTSGTLDITSLRAGSFFLRVSDNNGNNYVQGFCKK